MAPCLKIGGSFLKKCIIKTTAVLLALLFTISSGVIVNGTGSNLETQEPSEICSEKEGTSKTLYLKVPYYNDGQSLSTKSTTSEKFNAAVGDVFSLTFDEVDISVNVTWTTNNPQGLSYTVNENDTRQCEITILSYDYGKVSITANAKGKTKVYEFVDVVLEGEETFNADVGDFFDLYLVDSSGGSLNGFGGTIEWSTNNPNGIYLSVDPSDKTHCTATILSFNYGKNYVEANINGDINKYEFVHFDDIWESLLYSNSYEYSKDLAALATEFCDAANQPSSSDSIQAKYTQELFFDPISKNYAENNWAEGSYAYNIGYRMFGNSAVICVTTRGTQNFAEGYIDWLKGLTGYNKEKDFFGGYKVFEHIYYYEKLVLGALDSYIKDPSHTAIQNADRIAILITGHSLGGACASALAAEISFKTNNKMGSWYDKLSQDHIYAYTFGAIMATPDYNRNIENGFENIHNIYNYYDTFGPYGQWAVLKVGSFYSKFGHTDFSTFDYDDDHAISNYRHAVENNLISCEGNEDDSINPYWFEFDSKYYNANICKLSAKFSMLGYDQSIVRTALDKYGFKNIETSHDTAINHVDYFIAHKKIKLTNQSYELIFMGLIGTSGDQWYSDFDPKEGSIHQGFNLAMGYAYLALKAYLSSNGFSQSDNLKILLTGHSRGAAAANLLAANLIDDKGITTTIMDGPVLVENEIKIKKQKMENIFTYTFATPRNAKENYDNDLYDIVYKESLNDNSAVKHTRIFNIVNPEDFVTKCMPAKWGYGRYGKTFSLPSKTNESNYAVMNSKMQPIFLRYKYETENFKDVANVIMALARETYYYDGLYHSFPDGEENTYKLVKKLTDRVFCVEDYYGRNNCTFHINAFTKISVFKFFQDTLAKTLADGNFIELFSSALPTSIDVSSLFKSISRYFWGFGITAFAYSHSMTTYYSFVSAIAEELPNREFGSYQGVANCPVDVEIYEKATGELVGRIKDNVVDEEIAAKPNSVVMTVDGDSKSFWLPSDGDYDVKLIGNDNGTMDYTLAEIDSDAGEVKRVNYFDVPITKNEAWSGTTSSEDFEIEEHTLTSDDGTVLTYTENINEEEKKFSIDIIIEGNGTADTSRTAVSGDYVAVTATPDEGNTFDGWYENGELLTSDAEYAFVAKSNRTLKAKFSENAAEQKYTATFIADGKVIKTVEFSAGTATIEEPDVPYKEGYTGRWSEYVLSASDITINAVYEKISDNNPTANVVINVAGEKTIKYRTKVTIKATATNLDSKYHLVLCINGKEIKGNNKEVSYEYGELKNDVNYTVKIVDESNITQKDKEGKELKKSGGKITCNAGFFVRLIAFFQGLFNALPSETVEPK